jgi:hypothetical protein
MYGDRQPKQPSANLAVRHLIEEVLTLVTSRPKAKGKTMTKTYRYRYYDNATNIWHDHPAAYDSEAAALYEIADHLCHARFAGGIALHECTSESMTAPVENGRLIRSWKRVD